MTRAAKQIEPIPSKGERTRAKLLAVAAAEFARLGYHNTKVGDIVSSAGLSQPSFYIYFDSKEAAYEELVAEFRRRLQALTVTLLIERDVAAAELLDLVTLSFLKFLHFLAEDLDLTEIGFFSRPAARKPRKGWHRGSHRISLKNRKAVFFAPIFRQNRSARFLSA